MPNRFTRLLIVVEGFAQAPNDFSHRLKERLRFRITDGLQTYCTATANHGVERVVC
jgi:hypothetical protein